jgi:hypothetical protein
MVNVGICGFELAAMWVRLPAAWNFPPLAPRRIGGAFLFSAVGAADSTHVRGHWSAYGSIRR